MLIDELSLVPNDLVRGISYESVDCPNDELCLFKNDSFLLEGNMQLSYSLNWLILD